MLVDLKFSGKSKADLIQDTRRAITYRTDGDLEKAFNVLTRTKVNI